MGTVVRPGEVLWWIDGEPTVLLPGDGALYRTIESGIDDGPDVARLESALAALGHTAGGVLVVDEHVDAATLTAIESWQTAVGLEADGSVDPNDVVFLPDAVRVTGTSVDVGGDVESGSSILAVASVASIATLTAPVSGDGAVAVGDQLDLDVGDGLRTTGTVFSVSREVDTDSDTGVASVEVVVAFDDPGPVASIVDGTGVVATVVVGRGDGLTVPVGSLHAGAGGTPVVTVVEADGDHDVRVEPGVWGDGRVVVTGDLAEGDTVRLA